MDKTKLKHTITKVVLPVLGIGVLLAVALVAPNVVQILDINGAKHRFARHRARRCLAHLKKRGYLQQKGKRTDWNYVLTEKGRELLARKNIADIQVPEPKRWDGNWRMVIFDIPENYKKARNALRWKLRQMGFRYLNLSVWVHPYECRDQINAIVEYYDVGRFVRLLDVVYFDGMDDMKRSFFPSRKTSIS